MKTYFKITGILTTVFVIAMALFLVITKDTRLNSYEVSRESIVLLHRITTIAEENRNDLSVLENEEFEVEYAIMDLSNHLLYSHMHSELSNDALSLEKAIQKRYPYLYLSDETKTWGVIVLFDDGTKAYQALTWRLAAAIGILCLMILAGILGYGLYVRRSIIVPFENMKDFAAKVAQGKLDEPLAMDEGNLFGAFTESFDIMREELAASKERELQLQKKEREFVAALSHDLKTPVTGIKLTAELLQMKTTLKKEAVAGGEARFSEEELDQLSVEVEGIRGKSEQVADLLSDLFTSTLDELGEFKVNCQDENSAILGDIVKSYDDRGLAKVGEIPGVILRMDKKSMSQVIGNIISNSYKYANTRIDVSFRLSEHYLEMQVSDSGPGVSPEEIDLIINKFYRGKDWTDTDKDGHGLGLYIAKTLMQKMNGDLIAESDGKGLDITLIIPLS